MGVLGGRDQGAQDENGEAGTVKSPCNGEENPFCVGGGCWRSWGADTEADWEGANVTWGDQQYVSAGNIALAFLQGFVLAWISGQGDVTDARCYPVGRDPTVEFGGIADSRPSRAG